MDAEATNKILLELLARIAVMTPDEREYIFSKLACEFCMECGSDDPRCQCWNDE